MGKRGPKPGTGGRPRKALADKITEGNPGKRELIVMKKVPELDGVNMPEPRAYLSDKQKNDSDFEPKSIYESFWQWLDKRNCTQYVTPEMIEYYAISAARLIWSEKCISKYGFLAKHPTTGAAIASPYATIAQNYMKLTNSIWAMINQTVRNNCSVRYEVVSPQGNLMERLLSSR